MLVTVRACQGAFAAVMAPSALSILTNTFTDPRDRGQAFAVFGAIAGAGASLDLPTQFGVVTARGPAPVR